MTGAARKPHLLHLFGDFDAGPVQRRAVAVMNHCGPAATHAIISAAPAALAARSLIARGVKVHNPFGFPPLSGPMGVRHWQVLARAMRGFDLILTYDHAALDAALAHALFGPMHRLAPLIHHIADSAPAAAPWWRRVWGPRLALARASAVIVASPQAERLALDHWAQPRARVQLIGDTDVAGYAQCYASALGLDEFPPASH